MVEVSSGTNTRAPPASMTSSPVSGWSAMVICSSVPLSVIAIRTPPASGISAWSVMDLIAVWAFSVKVSMTAPFLRWWPTSGRCEHSRAPGYPPPSQVPGQGTTPPRHFVPHVAHLGQIRPALSTPLFRAQPVSRSSPAPGRQPQRGRLASATPGTGSPPLLRLGRPGGALASPYEYTGQHRHDVRPFLRGFLGHRVRPASGWARRAAVADRRLLLHHRSAAGQRRAGSHERADGGPGDP